MSFLKLAASKAVMGKLISPVIFQRSMIVAWKPIVKLPINSRSYSVKDTKDEKPTSILNEDLLMKAGFDDASLEDNSKKITNGESKNEEEKPRKKSKRTNKTSGDLKRERWANIFYLVLFGITGASTTYMVRDWDENEDQRLGPNEDPIPNGYTPDLMWARFCKRWNGLFSFYSEPTVDKLLPDAPPEPYRRPITLVLSLEDLMIHSEWDPKHGWRTAKRPGLEYFLLYLSQFYELVLFADNYMMYVEKVIEKIDPYNAYFSGIITKEGAKLKDGKVVKDLSLLNRDLAKIIILDPNPEHYSLQPENALPIKPWDGKTENDRLIKFIPFLEYLATLDRLRDVRPIISSFKNPDEIPEEFAIREQHLREQYLKEHSSDNNWAAKLLGLQIKNQSKMPLDRLREIGQQQYQMMKKQLEIHVKKEKERQQEILAAQKLTIGSMANSYLEGSNPNEMIMKQMLEAQQNEEKN